MKAIARLAFCLIWAACSAVQPVSKSSLLGEWRYADRDNSCQYVFEPDGRFHGEVAVRGKTVSRFTGRWSVEGDTLSYHYTGDAFRRIPAGATDRDKVMKVTANTFTIEAMDGSRREYRRIR